MNMAAGASLIGTGENELAPAEAAQVIGGELKSGESLVWSGQPRAGVRLQPGDAVLIPFGLVWTLFSLCWEGMALYMALGLGGQLDGPPLLMRIIFPLWGIPFILVGLYLLIGRFLIDATRRAHTYYGLTDQRIIICSRWRGHNVQFISLKNLPDTTLDQKTNGSGTISFGYTGFRNDWSGYNARRTVAPSFEMIENVREVQHMIEVAQQDAH